ncbi:MAG: tyrosine-type recombinase/integrase [Desulfobulbaceae bacterium]|nr:tyrosine-type recombinase/integrase [Desulfobulbaceae bacterium]
MVAQLARSSPFPLFPLADQAAALTLQCLAPKSLKSYNKTLNQFYAFLITLHPGYNPFPVNSSHISLYVTRLFNQGLAGSTITSRMSAISFAFKLFKKSDPVDDFGVKCLLKSIRKARPQKDSRLPLLPAILHDILLKVPQLGFTYYDQILFKSMLSLAFVAFLRPGEITGDTHNLQKQDVMIFGTTVVICFSHYKYSNGTPFTLYVEATDSQFCPVKLLLEYLRLRGPCVGPLFCSLGGKPISYCHFKNMFKSALVRVGVRGQMSPHSIRIGAATQAAASGLSDCVIQQLGRWRSTAHRNYVRLPSLQV